MMQISISSSYQRKQPDFATRAIKRTHRSVDCPLPALHTPITPKTLAEPRLWADGRRFYQGHARPSYTLPNERFPNRLKPVVEQMPAGTWVGVGTERLWMAAASLPRVGFLLAVDSDPSVVLYNQVNAALLRHASNREEYVSLRVGDTNGPWNRLAQRARHDGTAVDAELLQDSSVRSFWDEQMMQHGMSEFQATPQGRQSPYYGVHYLSQDSLYQRLAFLARQGRVQATRVDLRKSAELEKVADALRADLQTPRIAALDVSNAWSTAYMSQSELHAMIRAWKPVADPQSLLVGSHYAWFGKDWEFTYFAAHTARLSSTDEKTAMLDWLGSLQPYRLGGGRHPIPAEVEWVDPHISELRRAAPQETTVDW